MFWFQASKCHLYSMRESGREKLIRETFLHNGSALEVTMVWIGTIPD